MTDAISRQQTIDALRDYLAGKRCPDDGTLTCRLIENEVINKLPLIQLRTGKWIMSNVGDTFMTDAPKIIYCSSCNVCAPYATNYCPMCGADMRGEQDG